MAGRSISIVFFRDYLRETSAAARRVGAALGVPGDPRLVLGSPGIAARVRPPSTRNISKNVARRSPPKVDRRPI